MSRVLAILGSGETTPTMIKTHRSLLGRIGSTPAVILDTPYGFQENAEDISQRTVEYFQRSVGHAVQVVSYRSADTDLLSRETAAAQLRAAGWVFAGPGSPSYALRQWVTEPDEAASAGTGSFVPAILADKLRSGGQVVFSSAAALTAGIATIPVYEIYKAGESPQWLTGLDLLAEAGLKAAVIPHFDNAEGGHHDTRFCYLGERRLATMEAMLPADAFVLGVDEHTGCLLDLDAGSATVVGLGGVTVRAGGRSVVFPSGVTVPISSLSDAAREPRMSSLPAPVPSPTPEVSENTADASLLTSAADKERRFDDALRSRDVNAAVTALLELHGSIEDWSHDSLTGDDRERATAILRSLIVRLGAVAVTGAQDPRNALAPVVAVTLTLRAAARSARDWAAADSIRDQLLAAGIAVTDTAEGGVDWELVTPRAP
jgi:hypothetical protein